VFCTAFFSKLQYLVAAASVAAVGVVLMHYCGMMAM
jgi:NO-binding membrane sensor protein with MHYT domain